MSAVRATWRMLVEAYRFGRATHRTSLVLLLAVGFVLVVLTLAAQVVAPLALYPFA